MPSIKQLLRDFLLGFLCAVIVYIFAAILFIGYYVFQIFLILE